MNLSTWLFPPVKDYAYIQDLLDFDPKDYATNIILRLPLEILADCDLTDRIVKKEVDRKIKILFDLYVKNKLDR